MIDFKFSDTIKLVFKEASSLAKRLGNSYVDGRHLFIALYTVHRGVAYSVMLKSGLRAEDFQKLAAVIREQSLELQPSGILHSSLYYAVGPVSEFIYEFHGLKLKALLSDNRSQTQGTAIPVADNHRARSPHCTLRCQEHLHAHVL